MKDLTIVVLTYNSVHIVEKCLNGLNLQKYDVILVDNASSDKTVEQVQKNFPQIKTIKLPKNLGYAAGNNFALRQVRSEFALILNPDALIFEKDIDVMIKAMKKEKTIALAGPLILENYPLNLDEKKHKIAKIKSDLNGLKEVFYDKLKNAIVTRFLEGSVLFLRMEIFRKIGFFDQNIFLFYEDNEICFRTIKSGYKNLLIPEVIAFHVGGYSSKKTLKNIYSRAWHLNGWSKSYWKKIKDGKFAAKYLALRIFIFAALKAVFFLSIFRFEEVIKNLGSCFGAFSFLAGRKSFSDQ